MLSVTSIAAGLALASLALPKPLEVVTITLGDAPPRLVAVEGRPGVVAIAAGGEYQVPPNLYFAPGGRGTLTIYVVTSFRAESIRVSGGKEATFDVFEFPGISIDPTRITTPGPWRTGQLPGTVRASGDTFKFRVRVAGHQTIYKVEAGEVNTIIRQTPIIGSRTFEVPVHE